MTQTIAIDEQARRIVASAQYPTTGGALVTVTGHIHPDRPENNAYSVACNGCHLGVTYNAAAYHEHADAELRDRAARDDARDHGHTHANNCIATVTVTTVAPRLMVPLSVAAAATLLFSSEVPIEALNGADLQDTIAAEFTRRGCDLSRAAADVAYEYGEHPETAAAHMRSCVIVASRLMGVSL